MKKILYKKDVTGRIRMWQIEVIEEHSIVITHGMLRGAMQVKTEIVEKGLAGRSIEQQVKSRFDSRVNLQKDKGYTEDIQDANSGKATNALGFQLPMLAQRYDRTTLSGRYFVQNKLDGNRCLITKQGGKIFAYTRAGKLNPNISHITDSLQHIPEGMVLDGELYCHGIPLQTLRSWVSREQVDTKKLTFMCYDHISPNGYEFRLQTLAALGLGGSTCLVPTVLLTDAQAAPAALSVRLAGVVAQGYEGLILRHMDTGYETGKRSKSLIKLKKGMLEGVPIEEEEFKIVDVIPSSDGWGILVCELPSGSTFKVTAPGGMEEKYWAMENRDNLIGKDITVQFADRTMYGTPFHPVAVAYRDGD